MAAGIALGAWVQSLAQPGVLRAAEDVALIGTLWINTTRTGVIPLVAALTVASVATSGEVGRVGRLGGYAFAVFALILLTGGFFSLRTVAARNGPARYPGGCRGTPAGIGGQRGGGAAGDAVACAADRGHRAGEPRQGCGRWRAGAGRRVPLALGLALTRVGAGKRDAFAEICRAVSDVLLVVEWILAVALAGVFALALGFGAKMGVSSAGALLHYVLALSVVLFLFTLLLYPVATIVGRAPLRRFAASALPAQAVAFTTRSSLAALPTMIVGARDGLGLGARATGFVLPLAASVFRVNVPIAWVVGFVFLGTLYGVPVGTGALAMLVLTSTLISFSVPGIPSASLFLITPVLIEYGIPAEGVGVLIALDAVPDMFKTLANATAHLTSAAVVDRVSPQAQPTPLTE